MIKLRIIEVRERIFDIDPDGYGGMSVNEIEKYETEGFDEHYEIMDDAETISLTIKATGV